MATVGHGRGRRAKVQGRGQGQLLGLSRHHAVGAKEGSDGKDEQVVHHENVVILKEERMKIIEHIISQHREVIFFIHHIELVSNQTLFSKLSN